MFHHFRSFLDRTRVDEVEKDIESATLKYKSFMASLESEIKARKILLTALDQADRFYRNQRRDVKKVVYVSCPKRLKLLFLVILQFSGL